MSAQSQKGEDRIVLYLTDGLGMSHNKMQRDYMWNLVDLVLNN